MEKTIAIGLLKDRFGTALYEDSVVSVPHGYTGIIDSKEGKMLVCLTDGPCGFADKLTEKKEEKIAGGRLQVAKLVPANAAAVRMFLKWTAPVASEKTGLVISKNTLPDTSVLRALSQKNVQSTLVQASARELAEKDTSFSQLIDAATWRVLEAGFHGGYGAAGDRLESEGEVMGALLAGMSRISIDCSAKVDQSVLLLSEDELMERYQGLPDDFKENLEASYLKDIFSASDLSIAYTKTALAKIALAYKETIVYVQYLFSAYLTYTPWPIDVEISFAGSALPLSPEEHFLVGNELKRLKIQVSSLEPGLTSYTPEELQRQIAIAKQHGYRLAVTADKTGLALAAQSADAVIVKLAAGCSWEDALAAL